MRSITARRVPRCTWRSRASLFMRLVPVLRHAELFLEERDLERALPEESLEVAHLQAQVRDLAVLVGSDADRRREVDRRDLAVDLAPVVEDIQRDAVALGDMGRGDARLERLANDRDLLQDAASHSRPIATAARHVERPP